MIRIIWTDPARSDVGAVLAAVNALDRRLDKPTAMRVFSALHRFAETGEGDVKRLKGRDELRLRIGDYRLFFAPAAGGINILRVLHRSEAYR